MNSMLKMLYLMSAEPQYLPSTLGNLQATVEVQCYLLVGLDSLKWWSLSYTTWTKPELVHKGIYVCTESV